MWSKLIISTTIILLAACANQDVQNEVQSVDAKTITEPHSKPNILWIYIEDQNAWNNAYGDFTVSTPNIKKFAEGGVRFTNANQPAPVCSATRSALITGKFQTTLGVHEHRSNRSSYNGLFLPEGYKTVPEVFINAGYQTFNIGKDDYNFKYDRSKLYNAHRGIKGFQGSHDGEKFDWATKLKDKPFFGQIQLKGGKHNSMKKKNIADVDSTKLILPPYYADTPATRREWAKHYQTQIMSDNELAEILQQLEVNGILENTAVFWFSDHGMGLLRHKQELYEDGVKVPLIINWPAGQQALQQKGKVRNDLISGLDIPATSLALAGISIPEYYDGKNIFADDFKGREYVISAKDRMDFTFDRSRTVRSERFRYIRQFHPELSRSQPQFRDKKDFSIEFRELFEQGKLTPVQAEYFAPTKPEEELYDLVADPHQINNLASDSNYKETLLQHRQVLNRWIKETDDKGAYPESETAIKETLDLWGRYCVSVQCESYRKAHSDTLKIRGDKLYQPVEWPTWMPKPQDSYYEEIEDVYRKKFQ
ncbi:sulfatase [Psychrosphaera sp. B3R10]|uniref:sulfatase family protein n=1 Tax=unclassified Psychrosphaera TaxID=2641570 RepID=UPI001C08BC8C|nr:MULTISPECIES: sulfatase [unclassified Psychrosphaera]MBU2881734.1 sulfatase [Psychrosphaera sp. I2R16]MBU2990081.1 sulfatase [Psychrosphaera sp. B3R10]